MNIKEIAKELQRYRIQVNRERFSGEINSIEMSRSDYGDYIKHSDAMEIINELIKEIERKDKVIECAKKLCEWEREFEKNGAAGELDDPIKSAVINLEKSLKSLTQEHKEGEE